MKILHVGDLHIGKSLHGYSMVDYGDQKDWIDKFLVVCDEQKPDAVLVAGDVYDRSAPSTRAVELLDYFVSEIAKRDIPLLMIAGNHDSGERLEFASSILEKNGVYIEGTPKKNAKKITFKDEFGNVNIYLIPYLYPDVVSELLEDDQIRTYQVAMEKYLAAQEIDTSERNVIIAHQNIVANGVGIECGGSETMTGGVGPIEYSVFDGIDYVALGHIHNSYHVGREEVRYAGTPLCYHLDEAKHDKKGPLLVEIGKKDEKIKIDMIPIQPLHKVRYLKMTEQEIKEAIRNDQGQGEFVGVRITDNRITPDIYSFVKDSLEARGSFMVDISTDYVGTTVNVSGKKRSELKEISIEDLFSELYASTNAGDPPSDYEYSIMKKVSEIVEHQNGEYDMKEKLTNETIALLDKIIEFAIKEGENE